MSNGATPRARGLWLAAAVVVMVVVPWVVFGFQTGQCFDSASAAGSYCTSGPAVGVGGAVLLCLGGGLFVVHALRRALGGRSRTCP
jgi:protein-S-isoprenylcysteine O-methyltransferase Ste14